MTTRMPVPPGKNPVRADGLERYGVAYERTVEGTLLRDLLSWIVPALAFFAIWMFAARRLTGGAAGELLSIGKSEARAYVETGTKVTVAGQEAAS